MPIKDMTMIAAATALISVCSWIYIPTAVPFTMQTFGVFVALLLLGGKRGSVSIALYIFLGIIGLPVFSGFQSGIGHIMGPTGGYIIGFILMGFVFILHEHLCPKTVAGKFKKVSLLAGLLLCYFFGTLWFTKTASSGKSFLSVAALCVFPYIIPDLFKLFLAIRISDRIKKNIGLF